MTNGKLMENGKSSSTIVFHLPLFAIYHWLGALLTLLKTPASPNSGSLSLNGFHFDPSLDLSSDS